MRECFPIQTFGELTSKSKLYFLCYINRPKTTIVEGELGDENIVVHEDDNINQESLSVEAQEIESLTLFHEESYDDLVKDMCNEVDVIKISPDYYHRVVHIHRLMNNIAIKTRRGRGNCMLVGPNTEINLSKKTNWFQKLLIFLTLKPEPIDHMSLKALHVVPWLSSKEAVLYYTGMGVEYDLYGNVMLDDNGEPIPSTSRKFDAGIIVAHMVAEKQIALFKQENWKDYIIRVRIDD